MSNYINTTYDFTKLSYIIKKKYKNVCVIFPSNVVLMLNQMFAQGTKN